MTPPPPPLLVGHRPPYIPTNSLCGTQLRLLRPSPLTFAGKDASPTAETQARRHSDTQQNAGAQRLNRARRIWPGGNRHRAIELANLPLHPTPFFRETLTLITLENVLSWAFLMGPNWCLPW